MVLSIISRYKINRHFILNLNNIHAINVPELESREIKWLFKELLKIEKQELSEEEYEFIVNLLYGHPEQILETVKLLKLEGFHYIKMNPHVIVDFNIQKMSFLLNKYKENENAKTLLAMLSKFDFIDYELLYNLIGENKEYTELIKQFVAESICNEIGANRETIKLNRALRDAIRRDNWKVDDKLDKKIKKHILDFLNTYENEEKSLSDYFYSIQELLIENPSKIDISKIFPSHILKTIITLYDVKKKWHSVIELAKDALYENFDNLDEQIENQIRQYLCLAYIRTSNSNNNNGDLFLSEVQRISGYSHNFLLGFYYRSIGRYDDAIEKLKKSLLDNSHSRTKGELIQVYLSIHDYDTALVLAKEHYFKSKQNPYAFQAYISCLTKTSNGNKNNDIENVLVQFEPYKDNSLFSSEVYDIEYARFLANKNDMSALDKIDDAISMYPDSIYPKIAKFDIAERLNEIVIMEQTLISLKELSKNLPNQMLLEVNDAILEAKKGNLDLAKIKINQIRRYPEKSKQKLCKRLGIN